MLSAAVWLLCNSLFFSLRLAGNPGSFPRPLSAAEEKAYLERFAAGDLEARNVLIEHNLRLVAHIVKKYYTQSEEQDDLISGRLKDLIHTGALHGGTALLDNPC